MLRSFIAVVGGVASGWFLDYMSSGGQVKDALRWMYVWAGFWYLVALVCLLGVYMYWKRRGGNTSYTPPGSIAEREQLAGIASSGQVREVVIGH